MGSMKQFLINEREILVINRDGHLLCIDARCAHAGAPLSEGTLNGDVLTCAWHGSQFNITNGAVLRGPAQDKLQVFETMIRDNYLFVDV